MDECYLIDTVQARLVFGLDVHRPLFPWPFRKYVWVRLVIVWNERLASARYHEPPEAFQRTCCLQLGHGSSRHQTLRRLQTGQNQPINHTLESGKPSSPFLLPRSQPGRPPIIIFRKGANEPHWRYSSAFPQTSWKDSSRPPSPNTETCTEAS